MDEKNRKGRAKQDSALRGSDVIPPFEKDPVPPAEPAGEKSQDAAPAPGAETTQPERPAAKRPVQGETPSVRAQDAGIPHYDLAENILAEQRRVAGRRRRGPGRVSDEIDATRREDESGSSLPEPAPQDLQELERIVAEIVARDIERLCQGSNGQSLAQ